MGRPRTLHSKRRAPTFQAQRSTEKAGRAIESSSLAQRGRRVRVSCPSGVHQKKGLAFSCTTLGARVHTRFVANQLDGSGQVHYEAR